MATIFYCLFCNRSHLVGGPTRIRQIIPGELIELLIHSFGFGEAGSGIVEVSNRHSAQLVVSAIESVSTRERTMTRPRFTILVHHITCITPGTTDQPREYPGTRQVVCRPASSSASRSGQPD